MLLVSTVLYAIYIFTPRSYFGWIRLDERAWLRYMGDGQVVKIQTMARHTDDWQTGGCVIFLLSLLSLVSLTVCHDLHRLSLLAFFICLNSNHPMMTFILHLQIWCYLICFVVIILLKVYLLFWWFGTTWHICVQNSLYDYFFSKKFYHVFL